MSARLDYKPARPDLTIIQQGKAVRTTTWQDAAQAINYVRAHGSMLVATTQLNHTISAGSNATFRFRVAPGTLSKGACWLIALRSGVSTSVNAQVQVPAGASAVDQTASTLYSMGSVQAYYDTAIAGTSYTERELTFNVAAPAAGAVIVAWAACYETPRHFIDIDSTERGVDTQSVLTGQPIVYAAARSYSAIATSVIDAASNNGRRGSFYHWYFPTGFTTATTSYTAPIRSFPVLNRKLFYGETQRNMRFRVYASAATNTGTVRLTSSKGGSTTVTVSVGAAAWYPSTAGAPASLLVDSEDLSDANGLQGGTFNNITTEFKRDAAAGSCTLYGLSVWEDPLDC